MECVCCKIYIIWVIFFLKYKIVLICDVIKVKVEFFFFVFFFVLGYDFFGGFFEMLVFWIYDVYILYFLDNFYYLFNDF